MSSAKPDDSGLVRFHKGLSKDPQTLRIFERADDYVAIGDDAARVAQIVYKTASAALKKIGPDNTPMCTINGTLLANFLKDALQNLGLRIEFYTSSAGSRTNWALSKQASPGNLQQVEDLMGRGYDQNPVIIAVKVQGSAQTRTVGVSFLDTGARTLGLTQFVDNDLFSNLESLAIQLGVKEALIADDSGSDSKKLTALLSRLDILTTARKTSQFSAKDVDADLERLTGKAKLELAKEFSLEVALGAAGALVRYLNLMAHTSDYGHYDLTTHDLAQFMRLDASAIKALNVMPGVRDGAKSMSLFGLLNKCKTVTGARTLAQWLKQPLMDHAEIVGRHDLVEGFINNSIVRQTLQEDLFLVVPDLEKISRKFHKGAAKLEDIVRIYQLVIRLGDFVSCLSSVSSTPGIQKHYIDPLSQASTELAKFVELVETTVDLEALEHHEYVVNADFNERLREIRDRKLAIRQELRAHHHQIGKKLGMDPDKKLKLEEHHVYGWCFRLTRTDAGCLRNHTGFTELATQKAGIYFTDRTLRDMNTEFGDLDKEYRKTQTQLVRDVVNIASTYTPVLGPLSQCLAHLDVIVSFAHVSTFAKLPYVRPTMHERHTGDIVLKQARHPCMEAQDGMLFIPNDVSLKRDSSEFLIITGPNMGGKSTYIRQIGVISLMAQVGCFVPCESADLSIVDCVLARVGAGDSQLKGISTFMAEMLETASILKTATRESLIIIDELGRGTSTYDGFGLAWAISQHIVDKIGCFTTFATHFHELTALADLYKQVENLHVVANATTDDDITLLYQVAPGISDKSFGIHVAEVVNFPDKVVRMAKRKAQELEELDSRHAVSQKDIEAGTDYLQHLLKKWAADTDHLEPDSAAKSLRSMIEDARPEIEQQPFLKQVLSSL